MTLVKKNGAGILLVILLAVVAWFCSTLIPGGLISPSVFALLIGILLNPVIAAKPVFQGGIAVCSKQGLRLAIILMGVTLSFSQVFQIGKISLVVMCFTLAAAFGGGYLLGKALGMDWKLSSLISAGTGICGGSAISAIAPVIDAENKDIAYAISATFLFDILMVILFPIAGRAFGMSDLGFGLWAGTAVNDTSSVVAAGYAFSDAAGAFSIIVKLTRTLSIIPVVLIFSVIARRQEKKRQVQSGAPEASVKVGKLFPYFILLFLVAVGIKSTGLLPQPLCDALSASSKFLMVMALGAIGLKTNFKEMASSGIRPMVHGFLVSLLVVVVSFVVQLFLGQI